MFLTLRFVGLSLAWCVLAGSACADDAPSRPASKDVPPGLRFLHKTNATVISYFDLIAKSAGVSGHKNLGSAAGLDVPIKPSPKGAEDTVRTLMKRGGVDIWLTVDKNWVAEPAIEQWAQVGFADNPNFRLYHQARFLVYDGVKGVKSNADRDNSKIPDLQAALDKERKRLEVRVDAINKEIGKQVVFIVPVGDAIVKLRELVASDKYPGVTKQSELFKDLLHAREHVNLLTAYCNFAAIYRRSPEGIKLDVKDITDEHHAILQKIAWETVSKYPHSGVKE